MPHSDVTGYSHEQLLNIAMASPRAVAKHDNQAWLYLFADQSVVEDPVGTAPHRSIPSNGPNKGADNTQLDKFYDTFIAPNEIEFQDSYDIVADGNVMRDVRLQIMSSTGLITDVHMYLYMNITSEAGQLKVARLSAHWDLQGMVMRVISAGWPGFKMMTSLGTGMLKIQRLKGVWGYMGGFRGIGKRGKKSVQGFVKAANVQDTNSLSEMFIPNGGSIEFPVGVHSFTPDKFTGNVNESISVSGMISAGWATGFRFERKSERSVDKGIGLFEFDAKTIKIQRARFFVESLSS